MSGPGGRQRTRVAGAEPGPVTAAPSSQAFSSTVDYSRLQQTPTYRAQASPSPIPSALKQAAANCNVSSAGFSFKPEPIVSSRAATPPAAMYGSGQEPIAPRSWTPSKLTSNNSPARMSPAEALEREMAELEADTIGAATATVQYGSRPGSGSKGGSSGCVEAATTAASPVTGYYKQGYCNSAYSEAAGQALASGRSGSPAQPAAQPFVAQRNNLMGPSNGNSGGGAAASPGSMTRLKERLGVGHSSAPNTNVTTVEAFRDSEQTVVARSSSSNTAAGTGSSGVVAPRIQQKPRLLATGHARNTSRTTAEWRSDILALISSGQKLAALYQPGPSNGVVKCYVKRRSGLLGMGDMYELRLEANDELLAVARRRKKSATSSYLISMAADAAHVKREDEQLIGKLKANVLGTEYLLRGKGGDPALHKGFNAQLLAVNYKPTANHLKAAPRTMTAVLPVPESKVWSGSITGAGQFDTLLGCMDAARARELPLTLERDLVMLHTMNPHFDPVKQVHYLDFKGRVTKISMKNFQLVHWDHNSNILGNDLVMQFGKRGNKEYSMDFCYPLSLLQAFGLGELASHV